MMIIEEPKFKEGDKVRNKSTGVLFLVEEIMPFGKTYGYKLRRGDCLTWGSQSVIESEFDLEGCVNENRAK